MQCFGMTQQVRIASGVPIKRNSHYSLINAIIKVYYIRKKYIKVYNEGT